MSAKTEKKILIASRPFIKKSYGAVLVGCNAKNFLPIWSSVCKKYEKENGPVPCFGLPTKFFLNEVKISVDDLVRLNEFENRFKEVM